MKFPKVNYDLEVKDHRYRIHPTEINILRLREEPKFIETQYPIQNETQIRKIQNVFKNDNDGLIVKNYPKETTNSTTTKI